MDGGGERKTRSFFRAAQFASVGLEMGIAVAIGWAIGHWLDGKLGTKPWLMLLFLLFGVGAGFKALLDASKKMTKTTRRDGDGIER